LRWFETLGDNVKNSWDLLTESFLEEFGEQQKYVDLVIEITKLSQGEKEKIRDYHARVIELRRKLDA
ncbi:hypothetical protein KI387_021912, partial [Taxus chinensis]